MTTEEIKKALSRPLPLFPPHPDLPEDAFKCKCDRSKPRKWEDALPNAEDLYARGICPWCGWLED